MPAHSNSNHDLLVAHILASQRDHYRFAYSYVKNQDAALDVVQESIVKALGKIHTLRDPTYLKTWFYRILLNESMNYFRKNSGLVPYDAVLMELPAAEGRDPGERLDLYDAIDRLSEPEQAVIRLRFFEEMTLEEISRVTDTNLSTVKSRLYKGIRHLRVLTNEEVYDEREIETGEAPV